MKQIIEMLLNGVYEVAKGFSLIVWYFRRQLWFLTLIMIAMYLPLIVMQNVAFAPVVSAQQKIDACAHPQNEHDTIACYITEVFGEHATDAFKVLEGRGECGGENGGLNPFAVNTNWSKTPGVVDSKDYGIFQKNNKWQGVTNTAFLFDWRTNINMAWVIYKNSGYNFHLWTGGSCQGI